VNPEYQVILVVISAQLQQKHMNNTDQEAQVTDKMYSLVILCIIPFIIIILQELFESLGFTLPILFLQPFALLLLFVFLCLATFPCLPISQSFLKKNLEIIQHLNRRNFLSCISQRHKIFLKICKTSQNSRHQKGERWHTVSSILRAHKY
jgi:hypothetical protein